MAINAKAKVTGIGSTIILTANKTIMATLVDISLSSNLPSYPEARL